MFSATAVEGPARTFPAAPQLGAQQAGDRIEQAACEIVQIGVGDRGRRMGRSLAATC
ncbi:hypothetical protein ACFXG6_11255 [Streptomyces roseus]|uniref:hypothetical protein n=1 Tax=Streptomyces roseus TaxID=66430 RepID=UPI0036AA4CA2